MSSFWTNVWHVFLNLCERTYGSYYDFYSSFQPQALFIILRKILCIVFIFGIYFVYSFFCVLWTENWIEIKIEELNWMKFLIRDQQNLRISLKLINHAVLTTCSLKTHITQQLVTLDRALDSTESLNLIRVLRRFTRNTPSTPTTNLGCSCIQY